MLLAALLSAWLQYEADGQPHARAITNALSCPTAIVDERPLRMTVRASAGEGFNDTVCDVAVPASSRTIRVDHQRIPAPVAKLTSIVVLGDTGCRIKGFVTQSCNDPAEWPFPTIARAIARLHPDLIVQVGDYLYRETACPPFNSGCAGSPSGDVSQAWDADWFTPAAPMFASAPLVLVRGNHETCERSGAGWFHYLDAHPSTTCQKTTAPYAVHLPDLTLVVFDSAAGQDQRANDTLIEKDTIAFSAARSLVSGQTWFITHRPPYLNVNERMAMGDNLTAFSAVLAGHIHLFSAMNIHGLPPLIVNGEGGDRLDKEIAPVLTWGLGNLTIIGKPFTEPRFGFGVYTRTENGWSISLRDANGYQSAHCTLEHKSVHCDS